MGNCCCCCTEQPMEQPIQREQPPERVLNRRAYLIRCTVRFDYSGGGGSSGFHLGAGWIVTNSHCVNEDRMYSQDEFVGIVRNATISINGTQLVVSPANCKMIVYTRIGAGRAADFTQSDLALIYIPEIRDLPAVSVANETEGYTNPALGVTTPTELQVDQETSALHYGWNPVRPLNVLVSDNEAISAIYPYAFRRRNASTTGGSSGSPVFTGDYDTLVGVHFAGGGSAVRIDRLLEFMTANLTIQAHFDRAEQLRVLNCHEYAHVELLSVATFLEDRNFGVHYL